MGLSFSAFLSTCLLGAAAVSSSAATYHVERAQPDRLRIATDRGSDAPATILALRSRDNGIRSQVEDVDCDGRQLALKRAGEWLVPAGCRHLSWGVPLEPSGTSDPNAQRSQMLESGILLSEASSLPRLADAAAPEYLQFPAGRVFPYAVAGKLALPDKGQPFLFALMGEVPMRETADHGIGLFYFVDQQAAKDKVADMRQHMAGLKWLAARLHKTGPQNFSVLWLGVSADRLALSGQTGAGLLLVNYSAGNDQEMWGSSMRLYVPLHEAVHQMATSSNRRPVWYDESLASYLATRATLFVTNNDPGALAMFERFKSDGKHFDSGLIPTDRHVSETGDVSGVGAFYTKGVAFWDAVNTALVARGDSLENYYAALALTRESDDEKLPDFIQATLHLPVAVWESLEKTYLL